MSRTGVYIDCIVCRVFFRVLRVCRKHQNDDIIPWYMVSGAWNLELFVSILSFTSQGLLEVSEP